MNESNLPCFRVTLANSETIYLLNPSLHRSEQTRSDIYGKYQEIDAISGLTTEGNETLIPFNQVAFAEVGYYHLEDCLFFVAESPNKVVNHQYLSKETAKDMAVLGVSKHG